MIVRSSTPYAGNTLDPNISRYDYNNDAAGRRVGVKYSGVAFEPAGPTFYHYGYNTRSEVVSAERYFGSNTNDLNNPVGLQDWSYAYDNIGNRTASARADAISEYAANLLNQYTGRTVPGYADIIGTANTGITVTVNSQSVTRQEEYWSKRLSVDNETNAVYENINVVGVYSPGGTNDDIVTTVTGKMFVAETPEVFTYDADGNLLSDGRWNYVWDCENRLVAMSTLTNLSPSVPLLLCHFSYDYMSRRIGKTVYHWISNDWQAVSATAFLYDGWNLIQELITDDGSLITNSYICSLDLSGSLQGAGGVGGLLSAVLLGTNSVCYTFDGNGNVSEMLQVSGISPQPSLLAHYEYSPYGEQLVAIGPLAKDNPFRFSTKYTDNETRLVYYGYRYYSSEMGRWVSRDPLGERDINNIYVYEDDNYYCFIINNSINKIDLFGLEVITIPDFKDSKGKEVQLGALCKCNLNVVKPWTFIGPSQFILVYPLSFEKSTDGLINIINPKCSCICDYSNPCSLTDSLISIPGVCTITGKIEGYV